MTTRRLVLVIAEKSQFGCKIKVSTTNLVPALHLSTVPQTLLPCRQHRS